METQTSQFYEKSRDWGELAVTRLLAEPLFIEQPARGIASKYFEHCERRDATSWQLVLYSDVKWSSGALVTAGDVLDQIKRIRAVKGAGLACVLMLKAVRLISETTLIVETKVPIAHLDRILANPAFVLRNVVPTVSSGAYSIQNASANRITLKPVRQSRRIELVQRSYEESHDPFAEGEVDICGPMATPHRSWFSVANEPCSIVRDLDMVYVLVLPASLPISLQRELQRIDRKRICANAQGAVIPCPYTTGLWDQSHDQCQVRGYASEERGSGTTSYPIFFAKFAGNEEIARAVSRELLEHWNISTALSPCAYENLLSGAVQRDQNAFSIILNSALWPHPASMLAPHYLSQSKRSDFAEAFEAALGTEDLSAACAATTDAEDILLTSGIQFITIGRVVGCMRSRCGPFWSPPSGWIDFSKVMESET